MNLRLFLMALLGTLLFYGPSHAQQILPKTDDRDMVNDFDLRELELTKLPNLDELCPSCQTLPKTEFDKLMILLGTKSGPTQFLPLKPADPCLLPSWLNIRNLQLHRVVLALHQILDLSPESYETNQVRDCERKLLTYRFESLEALTHLLKERP